MGGRKEGDGIWSEWLWSGLCAQRKCVTRITQKRVSLNAYKRCVRRTCRLVGLFVASNLGAVVIEMVIF